MTATITPCVLIHVQLFANSVDWSPPDSSGVCPWSFPSKNAGVGFHPLLQGIFPTQGSNLPLLHLLHWQEGHLPGKPHHPLQTYYARVSEEWLPDIRGFVFYFF